MVSWHPPQREPAPHACPTSSIEAAPLPMALLTLRSETPTQRQTTAITRKYT